MVTDPLTGVYSRATLEQRLHEEIERAQRYGALFSMILLDLDHYKSVNDAFGHLRGDQVLVEFANRLRSMIRKSDLLFRYGGDEFLVLLPNTGKVQCILLAQRLLDEIRSQPFRGKPPLSLSLSLGVSSFPEDGHSPEALFEKADQRHYEAKRGGRGRVVGEDSAALPSLPFDEDARLVERDDALSSLHRFIKELPNKHRGILVITGPVGSGRSRFLSEVGKFARLQGYEVIPLQGSPALQNRTFGDLTQVVQNWDLLPAPSVGPAAFEQALQYLVEEKGRSGVIFTVENLPEVDWSTLELLQYLILSPQVPTPMALAFTADTSNARRIFPPLAPLTEFIELGMLSREGMHVWLRTILQWEAPPEFSEWVYQQTGGLPTIIKEAITELVERGIMVKSEDGWLFTQDYRNVSIKSRLGRPAELPPNNLPAAPTGFVGREKEIQTAKDLLWKGRVLTLTGPGGIGKTRLALQLANEVFDKFRHGVFWVPLASLSSQDFLISSIADSLKFSFFSREDPEVQLFNYLREKQLLLVLDNFEHLTQGADLISKILEFAPTVKALVTSRERLNLRGETVLELQGMSVPPARTTERIEGYAAVQLFLQSARRSTPNFTLTDQCKSSVVRICQVVEGLPLGIELAAAWVHVLTCEGIVKEIEQNINFLTTPFRDMPERHRSLRAVFEHSWNLLVDEDKQVLSKMAIFQGGFSREAALEIAGASLLHLSTLMDKSLLRRAASGRYEMHEVLRKYSQEKLRAQGEAFAKTQENHAIFYTAFLNQKSLSLKDERQREALAAIGEEMENVRAAWHWAIETARTDLIAQSLDSLYSFYEIRGLLHEGEQVFQDVEKLLETKGEQEGALAARILSRRGVFNLRLSLYECSRELLERSILITRKLDDRPEMAFALQKLGMLNEEIGEYEAARKVCQESLALCRELSDAQGIGRALNELGVIAYDQGEYQMAERYHQESLRIFREIPDPSGMASALTNLGNVESELGEYIQAKQFYVEGRKIFEEIGAMSGLAATLNNIGDIAREMGDYEQAREFLSQSAKICAEVGDRYGLAVSLGNLGDVAYRQGEYVEAQQLLDQSLAICEETGNRLGLSYSLTSLGNVQCALGEYGEAKKNFVKALKVLKPMNQALPLLIGVLVGVAALLTQVGDRAKALELAVFTLHHPATPKAQREDAEGLRIFLESELSVEQVRQAHEQGSLRPLAEVIEEVMGDHTFGL